jgi:peptide-methionine (R)-S-oxide reductase
VAPTLAG